MEAKIQFQYLKMAESQTKLNYVHCSHLIKSSILHDASSGA